jgi:excisionase family DNA binding protein
MKATLQQEWISIAQMQKVLGIGRTKAYELIVTGEVPAVKIGRVLRVNRRQLDAWLERQSYLDR